MKHDIRGGFKAQWNSNSPLSGGSLLGVRSDK
jgi:hypothetical protein